ncbi:Unknown protein [Striga hermonthica]|uniref:Uncharacterized protein n=1 Tax=Striga hermonthica TaxID=68872 RepID=A0A9N7NV78_STRHE|nr:Unknown protein [Striga hermonthica]
MAQSPHVVVEITSKEMVKPSSPTPLHLRTLKLSYIDQLLRSAYISFILFYNPSHDQTIPNDDDLNRTSRHLKESLSHTLTSFYPLAGRLLDSSTVHCNDAGAELSVARVLSRRLDEALLDQDDVERYLPEGPTGARPLSRRAASASVVGPTRVELVSAFVLESLLQALSSNDDDDDDRKVVLASHAVNLRPRKKALENMFGNCFMASFAYCSAREVLKLHELVGKLRESIRKVDEGYITGSENGGDVYLGDLYKALPMLVKGGTEACLFTSWCGFPFYEADFGWGRPVRVCPVASPVRNCVIFMDMNRLDQGDDDNNKRKGIEAWVSMADDGLEIIQKNFELISDDAKDPAENLSLVQAG